MSGANTVIRLVVGYVAIGMLFIGLSFPLIQRRVPPNPWYGFRTPRTVRDPEIWYPVNAYAGWLLLGVGVVTTIVALGLTAVPRITATSYALIGAVVMIVGVVVLAVLSFIRLRSLTSR